jgi:ribosomal-protein-alanine N-acetyltransferase
MAFSRSTLPDIDAELRGREVYLRQPAMGDYSAWAELRAQSRLHLTVWEPQWARDELARSAFRRRLRQYQRELRDDHGYAFLIFREADATLLGGLTVSNVRRGVAQSASVGYWIGLPHVGRGYMTNAVRAIVPFAFDTLALHRLEAACLPHNGPSTRVLEKAGFRREGTARRYLKINDVWQDHDLYALLHDDPRPDHVRAAGA